MNALIYAPAGGGKTVNSTLVEGKRNLLLNSDNSHIVLNNFERDNLDILTIKHWLPTDIKGNAQECFDNIFDAAVDSKKYDNIIVDNLSDLIDLAVLEYDEQGRIKDPRQYYFEVYKSIKRLVRKAAQFDCNVVFTAWHDIIEFTFPNGEYGKRIQPKIPAKILDSVLGLCQIVGFVTSADDNGTKRWYYALEGTPTLYAKDQLYCRKSCLPEKLFTK